MTIPTARTITGILQNRAFSYVSLWRSRLFKYENNFLFKILMSNRILWDVLYQFQLSLILQQSFFVFCLCALRQTALTCKNERKTGRIGVHAWLSSMSITGAIRRDKPQGVEVLGSLRSAGNGTRQYLRVWRLCLPFFISWPFEVKRAQANWSWPKNAWSHLLVSIPLWVAWIYG